MSEIRQMMTRKRQTHDILQYFMLFADGAPSFSVLKGTLKIRISEGFNTSNKCNPQSTVTKQFAWTIKYYSLMNERVNNDNKV